MSSCTKCDPVDRSRWVDALGVGFSSLCVVHCLALPVAIAVLPLWPAAMHWHEAGHLIFIALIVPTTAVAMWIGYRRHGCLGPLSFLAAGLLVVIGAQAVHGMPHQLYTETAMTVAGSSLLVAGHWRNYRFSRNSCSHA